VEVQPSFQKLSVQSMSLSERGRFSPYWGGLDGKLEIERHRERERKIDR
jgi:hypothetical protein